MKDLTSDYIRIMTSNRDLRMKLLMYAEELDKDDKLVNSKEVADKLIKLLKNNPNPFC